MPEKHNPTVAPTILSITTGIDLKTIATTNLYTVPAGRRCVVTGIIIHVTAATAFTGAPTLGVGIAAGEIDIMPFTALTGLTILDGLYRYSPEGYYVSGAAADVIKLGIDTGAIATTATGEVTLIGFLL